MSGHHHFQHIPRGALLGAAVLIVGTIGLSASARTTRLVARSTAVAPAVVESVDLRFEDRPGGALAIIDAASGRDVSIVQPGTNGFIRGVMRGMFRERKLEGLGRDGVFRLARDTQGRLTMVDLNTARRIELDSFGPTNSASFGALLTASREPRL